MPRVRIIGVPLGMIASILVFQTSLHAQSEDVDSAVSISRIRAALEHQPPPLQLPAFASSKEMPTFRMEIRERLPIMLPPPTDQKPIETTYGLPTIDELVMDGIAKIRSYKHNRGEHRARKEVEDALAAFCATNACSKPKIDQ